MQTNRAVEQNLFAWCRLSGVNESLYKVSPQRKKSAPSASIIIIIIIIIRKSICVCVCVLTRVAQIITATNKQIGVASISLGCNFPLKMLTTFFYPRPAKNASKIDFFLCLGCKYNSLLAGCSKHLVDKLQHVLNSAARVIFEGERRENVTPLLRDRLHWLRARERITFKLCLLVYKARNGMAPHYIEDLCLPVSSVSTRAAVRSAARGDLVIPRTRLRLGNRAFCVAGPAAWNSLPSDIPTASTLSVFKNRLKTHLFLQSYYVS